MKLLVLLLVPAPACHSQPTPGRIWWDGTVEAPAAPLGSLLSDNEGYWGDTVLTGVEYTYEVEPTNPADVWKDQPDQFGRRLLDGRPTGNWWVPVGVNGRPLVVTFDFRRSCTFTELDVSSRSKTVGLRVETGAAAEGPWRLAFERPRDDSPEQLFHRVRLPEGAEGRYVRLSVDGGAISWVEEVLVWGSVDPDDDTPEDYRPVVAPADETEIAFRSIAGAEKTAFSDAQGWEWQRDLGDAAKQPAVWSRVPTWDTITDRPLLPSVDKVLDTVELTMARNETECVALALTNTSLEEPRTLTVDLRGFAGRGGRSIPKLTGKLHVAGAIGSRHFGVNAGPLFEADNLLDDSLMGRYLTNGPTIDAFPRLTLSPGGAAVLWLSVKAGGAPDGLYTAQLRADGCPPVTVRARVLPVMLPDPPVWLHTWSGVTSQFPFKLTDRPGMAPGMALPSLDRDVREVAYKQSLGVTVWSGFPTEGTVAALARSMGRTVHYVYGLPDEYVHKGYASQLTPEDLTDEDRQKIAEHIQGLVAEAESLGMDYDDWFVELWDEPGERNSMLYGAFTKLIREADPDVHIYCNPCFWVGSGVLEDEPVHEVLGSWYRDYIDVSVPLFLLLDDRPKCMALFDAPRSISAFYSVSTQSAKGGASAQVEGYRRQAWRAASLGWNGWGFYSYYAPRGNPWTDFDRSWHEDRPDYLMVYPGPRGPIPTRPSEAVREGWEDYRALTLLKQRGKGKLLRELFEGYEAGEALTELRLRALRAAAD